VNARLEQRRGNAEGWTGTDRDGHELPVLGQLVDFSSIRPRARLVATVRGDGPLATRSTGMADALGFVLRDIREHDPNAS
jgi:hypothetical protein